MSIPKVIAIAAMDETRVIGYQGDLPWSIPADMKRFSDLTRGHTVLMGRKTYDSLEAPYKPLPKRHNVVCTRDVAAFSDESKIEVVPDAMAYVEELKAGRREIEGSELWVVGGAEIYTITLPLWDALELTLVEGTHKGDAFFPEFEDHLNLEKEESHSGFKYQTFTRKSA